MTVDLTGFLAKRASLPRMFLRASLPGMLFPAPSVQRHFPRTGSWSGTKDQGRFFTATSVLSKRIFQRSVGSRS